MAEIPHLQCSSTLTPKGLLSHMPQKLLLSQSHQYPHISKSNGHFLVLTLVDLLATFDSQSLSFKCLAFRIHILFILLSFLLGTLSPLLVLDCHLDSLIPESPTV